jgi:preprotein translocase subunit SecG
VFVGLSIVLAAIAVKSVSASSVDTTLNRTVVPAAPLAPADPLAQAAASGAAAAPAASPVPVAPADPLGSAAKK